MDAVCQRVEMSVVEMSVVEMGLVEMGVILLMSMREN
jgi:hypothetical protein